MALSTHRLQIFSQYSQQIQMLWKPELDNKSLCEGDYSERVTEKQTLKATQQVL